VTGFSDLNSDLNEILRLLGIFCREMLKSFFYHNLIEAGAMKPEEVVWQGLWWLRQLYFQKTTNILFSMIPKNYQPDRELF